MFPRRSAYSSREQQWLRHLGFKCLGCSKTSVIPMSTAHLRVTRIADGCITGSPISFSRYSSLSLSLLLSLRRNCRDVSKATIHVSSNGLGLRWVAGEQASRRRQRCCGRRWRPPTLWDRNRGFWPMETLASLDCARGGELMWVRHELV